MVVGSNTLSTAQLTARESWAQQARNAEAARQRDCLQARLGADEPDGASFDAAMIHRLCGNRSGSYVVSCRSVFKASNESDAAKTYAERASRSVRALGRLGCGKHI